MPTLDYANLYETQVRPRTELRSLLRALGVIALSCWSLTTVAVLLLP